MRHLLSASLDEMFGRTKQILFFHYKRILYESYSQYIQLFERRQF